MRLTLSALPVTEEIAHRSPSRRQVNATTSRMDRFLSNTHAPDRPSPGRRTSSIPASRSSANSIGTPVIKAATGTAAWSLSRTLTIAAKSKGVATLSKDARVAAEFRRLSGKETRLDGREVFLVGVGASVDSERNSPVGGSVRMNETPFSPVLGSE